jgi:predicted SnoaL-like aldol condensation-catalyzing enzyme
MRRNEHDHRSKRDFRKILCDFWIIFILLYCEGADQSLKGTGEAMSNSSPARNKAIVLEAFETLFNKRDYAAAERFWSPSYIQHSVAESDYVIAHGRFTGMGRPAAWIAADIVRFEDGVLKEHWDVLQDEASKAESVSGLPMFGHRFPS